MSLKVFAGPSEVPLPVVDWTAKLDIAKMRADKQSYLERLAAHLKSRKAGKNVGEIVRFPHADGYACYMVASWRPLHLVHIDLGDGWHYPHIERLTAADIEKAIQ